MIIKQYLLLCILFFSLCGFSQISDSLNIKKDSITYNKTLNVAKDRKFNSNLKEKYTGNDFTYIDNLKKPKNKSIPNLKFLEVFFFFMVRIFPYLLGLIVILIILKVFLGTDLNFWKFNKIKKSTEKLIFEEDKEIDDLDFEKLLKKALNNSNYRLATRYYYLLLLKNLSSKKHIKYHKDKTNSEYLFEIENTTLRKEFSYLSYVYNHVWYGDFPIDKNDFNAIEYKYKTFFNSLL